MAKNTFYLWRTDDGWWHARRDHPPVGPFPTDAAARRGALVLWKPALPGRFKFINGAPPGTRRPADEPTRKRSRDATDDEIFGTGINGHGPVQSDAEVAMRRIMDALVKLAPGFQVTLFLAEEPERAAKAGRLPRFNYASTAQRPDMLAVLRAFLAKQEQHGPTLDRIADAPPTGTRQ